MFIDGYRQVIGFIENFQIFKGLNHTFNTRLSSFYFPPSTTTFYPLSSTV